MAGEIGGGFESGFVYVCKKNVEIACLNVSLVSMYWLSKGTFLALNKFK